MQFIPANKLPPGSTKLLKNIVASLQESSFEFTVQVKDRLWDVYRYRTLTKKGQICIRINDDSGSVEIGPVITEVGLGRLTPDQMVAYLGKLEED